LGMADRVTARTKGPSVQLHALDQCDFASGRRASVQPRALDHPATPAGLDPHAPCTTTAAVSGFTHAQEQIRAGRAALLLFGDVEAIMGKQLY
jgi:hypothetical protein